AIIVTYALLGIVLAALFSRSSPAIETQNRPTPRTLFRVHHSRGIVFRLSTLFALDSFAGGLIVQSVLAWWFYRRFGLSPAILGSIFFAANILAGISALAAA